MNARTQDRQLGEAASAEWRVLNDLMIDNVAVGGVGLVHQRSAINSHGHVYFARLQGAVYGCGAIALHENLRVDLGFETIARESHAVGADGEIGEMERAVCVCA